MRRRLLLLTLLLSQLLSIQEVSAVQHCTGTTCVDVSTDPLTGKITIHVSKGAHGSTPTPKARVRRSTPPAPRPKPKPTYRPRPFPSHRAIVHRSSPKPTPVPDTFATDQLTQLIPPSEIANSPAQGAVTGVPSYFTTTSSELFSTTTTLLGVVVGLSLHSEYTWNFGDGVTLTKKSPDSVTHIFTSPGSYLVSLSISWGGTWSAGGFSYDVLGGAIIQQYQIEVEVHSGPTAFHR